MSRKVGIILSAIIAVIVGLWLWAGIIPKNSTSIGGSTSVDPVMQRLTNVYKKDYNGDSFIYSSSGSTGGVNNAKSGTYKIGFISRALDNGAECVSEKDQFKNTISAKEDYKTFGTEIYNYLTDKEYEHSGNQMHYVQIATDAIILTYNAPKWFEDNWSDGFDITTHDNGIVDDDWKALVQDIYAKKETWTDVAKRIQKINKDYKPKNNIIPEDKDVIVPFARETGSGTRNSFDNAFGLGANTGHSEVSKATEYNSNGMMYNDFTDNTFGYMSMNYLEQIQNNNDLRTALVNKINPKAKDFNMDSIGNEQPYNLTRPYIGLIKWDLSDKELHKISNFLAWISTAKIDQQRNTNNAFSQFVKAGLKPEFELDSSNVPRSGIIKPSSNKKQETNQTLVTLKQTINEGYLPKQ